MTGSVSVDEAMSDAELRRLLWRGTRELRPADITYRAAPLKGTGTVAGQSVVHLRPAPARRRRPGPCARTG